MADRDGYPTGEEIARINDWPCEDPAGLLDFVGSIWWAADWGWHREGDVVYASTGGWSGNEEIIGAMQHGGERANAMLRWDAIFWSVRRGGHYTFVLGDAEPRPDLDWLAQVAPVLREAMEAGFGIAARQADSPLDCGCTVALNVRGTFGCLGHTDFPALLKEVRDGR